MSLVSRLRYGFNQQFCLQVWDCRIKNYPFRYSHESSKCVRLEPGQGSICRTQGRHMDSYPRMHFPDGRYVGWHVLVNQVPAILKTVDDYTKVRDVIENGLDHILRQTQRMGMMSEDSGRHMQAVTPGGCYLVWPIVGGC